MDERTMTRKTRTRRPRIPILQSGYCEICHIPYNSLDDHIGSRRHQKLIGEDAGYISINGFTENNIATFLKLNIEPLDALDNDISSQLTKRTMSRRSRAKSVLYDRVKSSPLSPTNSEIIGHHHLRSRRNINYMTPPLDEDSCEKPDLTPLNDYTLRSNTNKRKPNYQEEPEPIEEVWNSVRSKRSCEPVEEVWNSGRPKRSCISRHKRISADERMISDNKTYYKVEVLSSKLRSSQCRELEVSKRSAKDEDSPSNEKGLIVKFKKLRNTELVQLNNEATNFLFPKKEDSSEEDEDLDDDGANTTTSSEERNESTLLLSSEEEDTKSPKFKVEDDRSMDSICSEGKRKKRRRTHAEAFINDNQQYYKFETPGSRLRYHGSIFAGIKSKSNGDYATKTEKEGKPEGEEEEEQEKSLKSRLNLDDYKFAFERVPKEETWYNTFKRQDNGESKFIDNFFWDEFVMPYQMSSVEPLDPKSCIQNFNQIKNVLLEPPSSSNSAGSSTPVHSITNSTSSIEGPELDDEDSKISVTTNASTTSNLEEEHAKTKKRSRKGMVALPNSPSKSKNPRKSPRQHASTLAILSSLINQRKRKTRSLDKEEEILPVIPEEPPVEEVPEPPPTPPPPPPPPVPTPQKKTPGRKKTPIKKKKVDYFSIACKIEEEINSTLEEEDNFEDIEVDEHDNSVIDFNDSKINICDILTLYDEGLAKEDDKSAQRFFNGTPGRKPGRKKRNNKTGWPNKSKRLFKKIKLTDNDDNDCSTIDSCSVIDFSDEEEEENNISSTDSISKDSAKRGQVSDIDDCDSVCDRVEQDSKKVLIDKLKNSDLQFQPYVCVPRLPSDRISKMATKRTSGRQRRMPGSPKSPRILRKPRGRWYRER